MSSALRRLDAFFVAPRTPLGGTTPELPASECGTYELIDSSGVGVGARRFCSGACRRFGYHFAPTIPPEPAEFPTAPTMASAMKLASESGKHVGVAGSDVVVEPVGLTAATPTPQQCAPWCGTTNNPVLGDVWHAMRDDVIGYCTERCRDLGHPTHPVDRGAK